MPMQIEKHSRNPNHPKKGSSIRAEPIRNLSDLARLKAFLAPCPRDSCILIVGINTALRANELVALKIGQVTHLKAGEYLILKQSKNKKHRSVTINTSAYDAIQRCLLHHPSPHNMRSPLLYSKTTGKALKGNTLSTYVKNWCREIGINGNYASHTMRKTFGFHAYRNITPDSNNSRHPRIAELMTAYGHATERQTLTYLCIQDQDISRLFIDNPL